MEKYCANANGLPVRSSFFSFHKTLLSKFSMLGITSGAGDTKIRNKSLSLGSSQTAGRNTLYINFVIIMSFGDGTFQSLQKTAEAAIKTEGPQILCLSKLSCSALHCLLWRVSALPPWGAGMEKARVGSCLLPALCCPL